MPSRRWTHDAPDHDPREAPGEGGGPGPRGRGGSRRTVALAAAGLVLLVAATAAGEAASVEQVLASLAVEPTVGEVQRAALRLSGLEPARTLGLLRRVRWAAVLPRLDVTVSRGYARDEDIDREWQQLDELSIGTDDDLDLRCTARWELDRLIYAPEELRASRHAADVERRRRELLLAVTRLYYELLLLRARERLGADSALEEAVERSLRIEELRAQLDGLTGGLMSRRR